MFIVFYMKVHLILFIMNGIITDVPACMCVQHIMAEIVLLKIKNHCFH